MINSLTTLVVGGAGYIGRHLVTELIRHGETVVVVDDLSSGSKVGLPGGCRLVVGDAGDADVIGQVFRRQPIGAVFHLAGIVNTTRSLGAPAAYYRANLGTTMAVVDACGRWGVRQLVFASTAAVYQATCGAMVDEDAALEPTTPYGRSKLFAEHLIADVAAATGMRYAILRYFNVAGSGPAVDIGVPPCGVISEACRRALQAEPMMEVFGGDYPTRDGTCVRDYVHVCDVARANTASLDHLRRGGQSFVANCGTGLGHSVLDVVTAVGHGAARPLEVRIAPRRPGDAPAVVADTTRLCSLLRWRPQLSDLRTIVAHTLAAERARCAFLGQAVARSARSFAGHLLMLLQLA